MNHINLVSGTISLIAKTLGYEPYSKEYEDFSERFWDIFEDNINDGQHRYIRRMCYENNLDEVNKKLRDWEIMYKRNEADNLALIDGD